MNRRTKSAAIADRTTMASQDSIDELMLRWEAARQQGRMLSPEELCADCPEMKEELHRQIRAVLDMELVFGINHHDAEPTGVPDSVKDIHVPAALFPLIPGYEILGVVDQGGMGVVYRARQTELGRTVAIKMISGIRLAPTQLKRFKAEAEAAARVQHPNLVQIFEVGQVNGRPFFSMEFLEGGNLAQEVSRARPTPDHAAEMVETLARAIHTAHERGIVHRDLKPSNVMLTAAGIPKITDFGLAKRLDDDSGHTRTGEILGTPSYMAPEQAGGKKDSIGPATDVYALGAILYELLAGRPPFKGDNPLESLRLVTTTEPAPPSKWMPAVPPELEAICLKCLEKEPGRRYASALALADDLQRYRDGHPVSARRIGRVGRMWKWIRRHPQGAALIAALVLLICLPVSFLIGNYREQRAVRLKAVAEAPRVREILQRNCFECHGKKPGDVKKNLNILDHQLLLNPARKIVVPGSPDNSRLIQRITDGSMPPEEEETRLPRLTQTELQILTDWVKGGAPPLPAEDPDNPTAAVVPYSELAAKVQDIFDRRCYECHKFDVAKGGIKIMNYRLLVTVRQVIVPGRPEDSELYQLITSTDEEKQMPPSTAPRLPKREIAIIRKWIEEGAPAFSKKE
jgi:serine/threonine protein kinase